MPKTVVMPQMGESVAEGTIVRWLKKVGDQVERDEPLFEISTDKVDAEIPSPSAGVLSDIKVKDGETVPINTVVGVIDEAAATPSKGAKPPAKAAAPAAPVAPVAPAAPMLGTPWSAAESRGLRLSPVVRKIAREHHVDVRNIAGSGSAGRVTKNDVLAYIDAGAPAPAPVSAPGASADKPAGQAPTAASPAMDPAKHERVPMTVMRRRIAEHMVMSKRTSPHVHSAFEVDFTKVDELRKAQKAAFEKAGGKLTYMSFITKACASALKAVPVVNASVDGADILYKKEINIGVAVALDWGLIVPVVKNADKLSLLEISKAIADLAARAREKKLKPEDVQGGTFTITNPGVFGALFGMPIISQPQLAIVGVGAVEKRPVVVDDAIAIRLRAYMTIGYDHRAIDGAIADEFMQHVKKMIEAWDSAEV